MQTMQPIWAKSFQPGSLPVLMVCNNWVCNLEWIYWWKKKMAVSYKLEVACWMNSITVNPNVGGLYGESFQRGSDSKRWGRRGRWSSPSEPLVNSPPPAPWPYPSPSPPPWWPSSTSSSSCSSCSPPAFLFPTFARQASPSLPPQLFTRWADISHHHCQNKDPVG